MIYLHKYLALLVLNTTQWWFRWQKRAPHRLWGGLVHFNLYWLAIILFFCCCCWKSLQFSGVLGSLQTSILCTGEVGRGRVCGCGYWLWWQVTCDRWQVTHDIWNITCVTLHEKFDTWHMGWQKKLKLFGFLVSVLLSAHVQRISVCHMRDLYMTFKWSYHIQLWKYLRHLVPFSMTRPLGCVCTRIAMSVCSFVTFWWIFG